MCMHAYTYRSQCTPNTKIEHFKQINYGICSYHYLTRTRFVGHAQRDTQN